MKPGRVAELAARRQVAKRLDPGMDAPLMHHEESIGGQLGELPGAAGVHRQRLLAVHRDPERERLGQDGGVGGVGCCDDQPVEVAELSDGRDDLSRRALARPGDRSVRARDDRDLAAELDEVSQDVAAPVAASD